MHPEISVKMKQQQFILVKNTVKTNDLSILKDLTNLKNLYSKQLAKMPRQYLVKLVFDTIHQNLIMKMNGKIVAGITFRGFNQKPFYEIAFLAVSNQNQFKGLGSKIMNRFKNQCQQKSITHVFTFADNGAIGFFQKHGFSKQISLAEENYKAYIKEYLGGQLMECQFNLNLKVDFETLKDDIKKLQDHLVFQQVKPLLPLAPYDVQAVARIVKKKENKCKTLSELCEFIPGLKEAGFIRDKENDDEVKLTIEIVLVCQQFIELAFAKASLLEEGIQEIFNQNSLQSPQKTKGQQIVNDYYFLLYKLERKLKFGHFKYKHEFIEEFTNKLKKILSLSHKLKSNEKEFLTKIDQLKYEFMKHNVHAEKLKSVKIDIKKG